jgi:hypothetical protein
LIGPACSHHPHSLRHPQREWLPLLNPNAAGNEIDRLPPMIRQAREAIVQGIQAFYCLRSQTGKDAG